MPADEHQHRTGQPGTGRVRSSTAERERTASILRAAAETGLLTLDESDERMATCYQSQYRDQLAPLLADLPEHGRGLVPPDPDEEAARRHAAPDDLGRHAGVVVVIGAVLVGIWAISGAGFFWPAWPLGFLALTLVFHARHRARQQQYARAHEHLASDWGGQRHHGQQWHSSPCRVGESRSRSW